MSQIFKSTIEPRILFDFLDQICIKTDNKYVLDNTSYKKAGFLKIIDSFIKEISPHYHISKQYYVTRKPSYKMLTTIIRQICRLNNIFYKQNIIYRQSQYEIVYSIYYNSNSNLNSPKNKNKPNLEEKYDENLVDSFNE